MRRGTRVLLALALALVAVPATAHAAFPGENGRIAFGALAPTTRATNIYTMDPSGANQVGLTDTYWYDQSPAYSPEGTKVAWAREGHILVMGADGSDLTYVTDYYSHTIDPAFSPDGETLVFARGGNGGFSLYTVPVAGGTPTRLTRPRDGKRDHSPAWSPNGRRIAFVSNRRGPDAGGDVDDIYLIKPNGRKVRRVTRRGDEREPNWHPNGRRIAFDRSVDGRPGDIFSVRRNGSHRRRHTSTPEMDEAAPAYSPDRTQLVFEGDAGFRSPLLVMDLTDGSVTPTGAEGWGPDWQPLP